VRLSRAAAIRVTLAAQGFARPRPLPGAVRTADLSRVLRTVRVVQIDSVNVLTRSQYLPFFSRLGPYDVGLLDRLRDQAPRRAVEYWAHEASLIDPALWPLLGFRMARAGEDSWGGMQRVAREHAELVATVRAQVAALGPLTARELERAMAHDRPRERADWGWNWSLVKNALEHLFWAGEISSAGRTSQFERRYAPTARVLPSSVRAAADPAHRPPAATAYTDLIEISARALGIGTEQCLRDYVRLRPDQARPEIEALVASGVLVPARIEGWARPAYLHREVRRPRRVATRALLSPFDSLIWQRDRVRVLWGFDYRLEIYVPAEQRKHGYYVLPFLLDEALIARVDLKADRAAGVLRVNQLTWEGGRGGPQDRAALESELDLLAAWLLGPGATAGP
jgi:uncharacterized protein YcaQ